MHKLHTCYVLEIFNAKEINSYQYMTDNDPPKKKFEYKY